MKNSKHDIVEKVRQWTSYADEDLRFAEHGLTLQQNPPYRLIAYHAQQCAEKYLKAFLVFKEIDFPYTHNISALLEIIAKYTDWSEDLMDAEELTQFAITARYPGEDEFVDKGEALRAIELARAVRSKIKKTLTELGILSAGS